MKDTFIYFILGVIVVAMVYGYLKLNQIEKLMTSKANGSRISNFNRTGINGTTSDATEPVRLKEVTAEALVNALREKLNGEQIKELNVTFTQ